MQIGKENEKGFPPRLRFSRLAAGKIQRALQTWEKKNTARVLHISQMKQMIIGPLNDSHALCFMETAEIKTKLNFAIDVGCMLLSFQGSTASNLQVLMADL